MARLNPASGNAAHLSPRSESLVFLVCAGLIVLFVVTDAVTTSARLGSATNLVLSELEIGMAPIPPGARERETILPVSGIDGKWWVIHTEQALQDHSWRIRRTTLDNSPEGREVHWSSSIVWFLSAISRVLHTFTVIPLLDCVPIAAMFAGPVLLLLLMAVYAAIVGYRFGWATAGLGVLFFATCAPIFDLFRTGVCDHHGLVGWFATTGLLCLVAGGAGFFVAPKTKGRSKSEISPLPKDWPSGETARKWFMASGILSSAALWVSSATAIPILIGTGLGALLAGFIAARNKTMPYDPNLWRIWGRAGCLGSLFFYLLEYFPAHMGWRLEVNHPLYALAWLGGGEILARVLVAIRGEPFLKRNPRDIVVVTLAVLVIALPAVVIAWKTSDVFWVSDKFLLALHNEHIGEFQPFFEAISGPAIGIILVQALILPTLVIWALAFLGWHRSIPVYWVSGLAIVLMPALVMLALGLKQTRWMGISMCLWSLAATLIAALFLARAVPLLPRWQTAVVSVLAAVAVLFLPYLVLSGPIRGGLQTERIPKDILPNVIARDVVQRILRADPSRMPVILSGPTTSTDLAYYGGCPMIGTLYWENMPGLKAAAEIFSAPTEEEAWQKLHARHVTHILLFSWDEFSKDYSELWGREIGVEEAKRRHEKMFVTRLVEGNEMPQWVRPLFYPIPPAFDLQSESVSLFEIVPDQSRLDSLIAQAIYRIDARQFDRAGELLARADLEFPGEPRFQKLRRDVDEAVRAGGQ